MNGTITTVNILLVDNDEDEILAIRHAFQKSDLPHRIIVSTSGESALQRAKYDADSFNVVVGNQRLPQMSGLALFTELRKISASIPLIFLTEIGSENLAAEALRIGADGFLLKDRDHGYLALLPVVLCNVLRQYKGRLERKLAEEKLKKAHLLQERTLKFTEALLSAIPTPVFYKDKEGLYLGCNRAFTEMMGMTSEELRGKTVFDIWPMEQANVYNVKDLDLMKNPARQIYEFSIVDKDGMTRSVIYAKDVFLDENNELAGIVGALTDITELKLAENAKEMIVEELQEALAKVKQLSGLLPICASCKKIRDDKGYWNQIELYIRKHSEAKFSHGLCPECAKLLYPEYFK